MWGYSSGGTSTSLTRDVGKSGGSSISALTDISSGSPLRALGQFGSYGESTFNWSNGAPTATATGAFTGIQHNNSTSAVNEGFTFTVPASTTPQRLILYLTTHVGVSVVTASLSDGSAPAFTQTINAGSSSNLAGFFTVDFASATAGQTLLVSARLVSANASGSNVAIQAAALGPVPVVLTGNTSLGNVTLGQAISTTFTASGGVAPYTWSGIGLPSGITVANGVVSGTPAQAGNYTFTIQATDSVGTVGSTIVSYTVVSPLQVSGNATLGSVTLGQSISGTLTASGGVQPYTWSASGLPTGITNSNGSFSGTPAATGAFSFVLTVNDSTNNRVSTTVTYTVVSAAAISVQNHWRLGETDSPSYIFAGPGNATTTDLLGSLNLTRQGTPTYANPAPGSSIGMNFNGSSGYLSTSPVLTSTTDNFGMEIWARPSVANQTAVLFYNGNDGANGWGILLVNGVPNLLFGNQLIIAAPSAIPINVYSHIAITRDSRQAAGGFASHLWVNGVDVADSSANNPNPPSTGAVLIGQNFKAGQRFIGDLDEARIFTFTSGQFQSSLLLYQNAPQILNLANSTIPLGQTLSGTLNASGGTAPYTWSATGLPAGASVSSDGTFTGTATPAGTYRIGLQVTDAKQATGTATVIFTVTAQSVQITGTTSLGTIQLGQSISGTLTASGGVAPYTWTASGLPSGITASNGSFSGTPVQAGAFSFVLTATDSSGAAASATVTYSVIAPVLQITGTTNLGTVQLGQAISGTLTASGGVAPYTWTASGLPAGITSSNGAFSGTPAQPGTFSFVLQVKDSTNAAASATVTYTVAGTTLQITGTTSLGTIQPGQPISGTLVASGGVAPYTWTATGLPQGFTANNGSFSGTAAQSGAFSFVLQVTDSLRATASATITFTVAAAPPLQISGNGALGEIALGQAVSGTFAATGGSGGYTWTGIGVPPGIVVGNGNFSGIPAAPGNYSFTIQVTDSRGAAAVAQVSFSVFGLSGGALPPAVTQSFYSTSVAPLGVSSPWTISGSGAPAGITIAGSGLISGTATTPGNYTLTLTARDGAGVSSTAVYTLTVSAPAPLKVPGGALSDTVIGTPTSLSLSASGGVQPYTWTIAAGSIPPGLTFRSTGALTGTPSKAGSYTFTARATDLTGVSGVGTFSLNILPPPVTVITPPALSAGMVSVDYPAQTLSASGGTGPYRFSVTAGTPPAGLALDPTGSLSGTPTSAGSSSFTVTATDANGATGAASLTVTIRPFSPDLSLLSGTLGFTLATGSAALPASQTVAIQATDVNTALQYTVAPDSQTPWAAVSPAGGSTPGTFSVGLNSAAQALGAGSYQGSVIVTCASGPCQGKTQTVGISLTIANAAPQLTLLNDSLPFTTSASTPKASTQNLGVQNTGGGTIGFASVSCAASWCTLSGAPGSLGAGATAQIAVSADPSSLSAGYYFTSITLVSSAGTSTVPVTLYIPTATGISLAPSGALFVLPAGGVLANGGGSFAVTTSSDSAVAWTASLQPGASWLTLGTTSGTSTSANAGTVSFSIDPANSAALAQGNYYGTIRVTSAGPASSPQDFQVILSVTAASARPKPLISPAGVIFLTRATSTPPPQTITLAANSATPVNFQASAATSDGKSWLSVTPLKGSTSALAQAQPSVAVNPSGLNPGVYSGTVSFSFAGSAVRSLNVTLVVQKPPTGQPVPSSLSLSSESRLEDVTPGCTASRIVPAPTGIVSNFAAPASWPTPIAIQLITDCGGAIANGQITATFSNGDPPLILSLTDPSLGIYSGTWTPRRAAAQTSVSARATAPGFTAQTTQIAGAVTPNNVPILTHNATSNLYNPVGGAPLAPGTLVQISGQYLAGQATTNSQVPLPTTLGGTTVLIGGIPAPLSYVSPGTVNAQMPFELVPGQPYQVIVNANGALTTPDPLQSGAVSPALSVNSSGFVNAQHLDGTTVTQSSPAAPGETITIYLAGLGLTDVPVASGSVSPSSPVASASVAPTVTLDSTPATYQFAGLAPKLVGVYQINMQVPSSAKNGDLPLVVSQGDLQTNSGVLSVRR